MHFTISDLVFLISKLFVFLLFFLNSVELSRNDNQLENNCYMEKVCLVFFFKKSRNSFKSHSVVLSIVFENGELTIDNDETTLIINKQGPSFLGYGAPFDLITFQSFNFSVPNIQLPDALGIPPIPKLMQELEVVELYLKGSGETFFLKLTS